MNGLAAHTKLGYACSSGHSTAVVSECRTTGTRIQLRIGQQLESGTPFAIPNTTAQFDQQRRELRSIVMLVMSLR